MKITQKRLCDIAGVTATTLQTNIDLLRKKCVK